VRLRQGDPNAETVYGDDPAAMAEKWAAQGADWLHVVNLDGAFGDPTQAARNVEALQTILSRVTLPVQFGGGLRSLTDIERALALGVSRVVVGSLAAEQPEQMLDLLAHFGPERVALGLDVREGKVATHGWQQLATIEPFQLAQQFQAAGLAHVIYTDISRDGMLHGVNVEATAALARAARTANPERPFKVIASGGVAGLDDLRRLKAVEAEGIEGVIIGKALYTGVIDLTQAKGES
jgi:phosphoribosylformimino-5-aminoimidazole carboxamide ribotide isomerase